MTTPPVPQTTQELPRGNRRLWYTLLAVLGVSLLLGAGWVTQRVVHGGPVTHAGGSAAQDQGVLGETVRDGQFEFLATDLVCGLGEITPSVDQPDAVDSIMTPGQFCTVELSVRNIGSQSRSLTPENLRAHTDTGRQLHAHEEAVKLLTLDVQKPFRWYVEDSESSFTLVFELYGTESIESFEFHDSKISKGAVITV